MFAAVAARLGFGPARPREADRIADVGSDEDDEDAPTLGSGASVRELFVEPLDGAIAPLAIQAGAKTSRGPTHRTNEDAMLVMPDEGIYAVADGMGGHVAGNLASQLAIAAIATAYTERSTLRSAVLSNVPLAAAEMVQSFAAANEAIRAAVAEDPRLARMGTTLVASRYSEADGRLYVAHVGDSRCYRLRDRVLEQLTRDHTMRELGVKGREGAMLSRAVGPCGIVEADVRVVAPRAGDVYILCSDGLTKALREHDIATALLATPDPAHAAQRLVEDAVLVGARDDVSVVVMRAVRGPERGRA